jgi:hypothetical protein
LRLRVREPGAEGGRPNSRIIHEPGVIAESSLRGGPHRRGRRRRPRVSVFRCHGLRCPLLRRHRCGLAYRRRPKAEFRRAVLNVWPRARGAAGLRPDPSHSLIHIIPTAHSIVSCAFTGQELTFPGQRSTPNVMAARRISVLVSRRLLAVCQGKRVDDRVSLFPWYGGSACGCTASHGNQGNQGNFSPKLLRIRCSKKKRVRLSLSFFSNSKFTLVTMVTLTNCCVAAVFGVPG